VTSSLWIFVVWSLQNSTNKGWSPFLCFRKPYDFWVDKCAKCSLQLNHFTKRD